MAKFNVPDPRNERTKVWVNGLVDRADAKVSVLDSLVQGGDGVWEGLRLYKGKIFKLDAHLDRMIASAKALNFAEIPSREEMKDAIQQTLDANGMEDGVHIRLTLSRGKKGTSGMNPQLNTFGPTLIVLAEWKGMVYGDEGISLITASTRRNPPQCLDSKIHHNNLLNNILAKIESNVAGADDAVMLDVHGFLAETNATNIFLAMNEVLVTPTTDSCVEGITRATVLECANEAGIQVEERNISPSEMYAADEMFTTGTMGELAFVKEVDGRVIGTGVKGEMTQRLQEIYSRKTAE